MGSLGFYFNMDRCIGCKTCQIACKEHNKLPVGEFFRRAGSFSCDTPSGEVHFSYSGACNHCADPACVNACPTGAMHRASDGTVVHDNDRCIGCGRCVHSCPYGAVSISELTGYAQKCDACASLRAAGEQPACVLACPTRALSFGDTEELQLTAGEGAGAAVRFLPDISKTMPSTVLTHVPEALLLPGEEAAVPQAPGEDSIFRKDTDETVVILGTGPAAVTAAEEFRRCNQTARIVMYGLEKDLPYTRPLLSKALLKGFTAGTYRMVDEQWLKDKRVELHLGDPILSLDTDNHCVVPRDGAIAFYDKCIYALGADSFVPPIPGKDLKGVLTVRKQPDLEQVRRMRLRAGNAAVIGGGFIGLETAWQLQKDGMHVTIVEITPSLMGRLVDARTAEILKERIQAAGVDVVTGVGIEEICGGDRVSHIRLTDGTMIPAELVIVSTGVRANAGLAKDAGLAVGRAVTVNEFMETSASDVYACGDCCEYQGMNAATWVESIRQGKIAGANAAGGCLTFSGEPGSITVHTAGTALYAIGDMGKNTDGDYTLVCGRLPSSGETFEVNPSPSVDNTHFTACFLEDRLVGMTLAGDLDHLRFVRDSIGADQQTVLTELKKKGAEFDEGFDEKRMVS